MSYLERYPHIYNPGYNTHHGEAVGREVDTITEHACGIGGRWDGTHSGLRHSASQGRTAELFGACFGPQLATYEHIVDPR